MVEVVEVVTDEIAGVGLAQSLYGSDVFVLPADARGSFRINRLTVKSSL